MLELGAEKKWKLVEIKYSRNLLQGKAQQI
jgi:hypothetical protein